MEADIYAYISRPSDCRLNLALVGILVLQFVIVFTVLGITSARIEIMLAVGGLLIVANVANLFLLTHLMWKPYERRWPAQPILPGAVVRGFQTIWFGPIARYNHCVHVALDERHIHVTAFAPMRWCGAGTISLPLDDLADVRSSLWPSLSVARLHGRRVAGPSWCFDIAA